jgi:hypothetical protein
MMFMTFIPYADGCQRNDPEEVHKDLHDPRSPEDRSVLEVMIDDEHARHQESRQNSRGKFNKNRLEKNYTCIPADDQEECTQEMITAQQPVFGGKRHRGVN